MEQQNFETGDFVVVGEDTSLIGIVRSGRKYVTTTGRKPTTTTEVEVWFGDFAEGGLPLTYYVAENLLLNLKAARITQPFFKRNRGRDVAS